jgi:hypothetical protein
MDAQRATDIRKSVYEQAYRSSSSSGAATEKGQGRQLEGRTRNEMPELVTPSVRLQ